MTGTSDANKAGLGIDGVTWLRGYEGNLTEWGIEGNMTERGMRVTEPCGLY